MAKDTTKVYVDLSDTRTMEELLTGTVKNSNFAEDTIISGKIVEKSKLYQKEDGSWIMVNGQVTIDELMREGA